MTAKEKENVSNGVLNYLKSFMNSNLSSKRIDEVVQKASDANLSENILYVLRELSDELVSVRKDLRAADNLVKFRVRLANLAILWDEFYEILRQVALDISADRDVSTTEKLTALLDIRSIGLVIDYFIHITNCVNIDSKKSVEETLTAAFNDVFCMPL